MKSVWYYSIMMT